jgi:hypothetical protein
VGTIAWLSLIGVAIAGIVEANISYVDELPAGQRRRPLPDSLRAPEPAAGEAIQVKPVVGDGWVGVTGTF